MEFTLQEIWSAAGVIAGFQIAAFTFRLEREAKLRDKNLLTWLPPADLLNLGSLLITLLAVFAGPVLGLGTIDTVRTAFGLAVLLLVGWAFALVGHYELLNRRNLQDPLYFPRQERIAITVTVVVVILYLAIAISR